MVASFRSLTSQETSLVFNWIAFPFLLTKRRAGEKGKQME